MRLGVDGPTVKEGRFAVGHSLSLLVVRLLSNLRRELKPDSLDEDNLLTCARSSPALLRLEAESEQHSTWTGAAVVLAADALSRTSSGNGVFRGDGLPEVPDLPGSACGCDSVVVASQDS